MTATLLTLNAGSSSVKFQIFGQSELLPRLATGGVGGIGHAPVLTAEREDNGDKTALPLPAGGTQEDAVRSIIHWIQNHDAGWEIKAVAHRIVHGGTTFAAPVSVNSTIFHQLKLLIPLAPMHQPHNLAALGIALLSMPHIPQVACFDTAFHAKHEPLFTRFAIPQEFNDKGVRRYGFHGLSYQWIAQVLRKDYPDLALGRVVVAHLGNGASLCALKNGASIDTTMGMTALDGVVMGTRVGAIDAGAVIYMIRDQKLGPDALEHMLYEHSGLQGLSGVSNDVKILLESPDPRAKFALDYFALSVAKYAAMMTTSLGGIDAMIFTGGIGENATAVREAIIEHLQFLKIGQSLVIPANEERMMAIEATNCLKSLQ